jgi:transcriptional regulator with PAS, ATPase and Fis domain
MKAKICLIAPYGVIAIDKKEAITIINPAAKEIFKIGEEEVLGCPIKRFIPNSQMGKVLRSGIAETGQLQELPSAGYILTNRVPVIVDQAVKGVVATFQEVSRIQADEQKIRQTLYAKGLVAKYTFSDIIHSSMVMRRLIARAKEYARSDATVLIQGENGTGKEVFAQSIHRHSDRALGPFVAINCSALPPQLLGWVLRC